MDSSTSLLALVLLMIVNVTILNARENLSRGIQPKGSKFVFWAGIGALITYLIQGGLLLPSVFALISVGTQAMLTSAKRDYEASLNKTHKSDSNVD